MWRWRELTGSVGGVRSLAVLMMATLAAGCVAPPVVPSEDHENFGVLVMAHGGSRQWNDSVLAAVQPLRDRHAVEVAFGMADAASLQESVRKLEARGVENVAVVRLFVSGESWFERTEQILGLKPGAPARAAPERAHEGHQGHSMEFWQIDTDATFALSKDGLANAPEVGDILADRASALSTDPRSEDVLILAHGPDDDAENDRWIEQITARSEPIRRARPFRRVEVQTLREDWPEKRAAAEAQVRAFVQRAAAENGKAIVIPFRVQGFGPYARVLSGLDYVSDGAGLLPHPNVTRWIERQVAALREELPRS